MADPFYEEILQALAGPLDVDRFELCAASLLTKEFPTLVPIRGGSDSGMDGATAADGPLLICTTDTDVNRNLTGSLKSYLKECGPRRTVLLATSQELTQKRRANLENKARKLGFSLLQIYSRAAMAERLYFEPRWCKDLLGLTGRPSALTMIPLTDRPLIDQPLLGRDEEIKWLLESHGDRLLVGQPGSGKTSLLRDLALKGWGLFLVDDDSTAIANAIRKQQPKVIIADDAHFRTETLSELRRLRREIDAQFDIVATSWTGDRDLVAEKLMLSSSQICELQLLTRDEIVQVIRQARLGGPIELIREIVNQAEGRPGLAVTLSHLSLSGDVRDVLYGNALSRSLLTAFQRLVGKTIAEVLAVFALGGDDGVTIEYVSKVLGLPMSELRASLVKLAAGGVLRQGSDKQISVWPRSLRYVLVRDVFFSGLCDLPYTEIASGLPNMKALGETLLGAVSRGANVPEITNLLESINSPTLWRLYASIGEKEADFVLNHYAAERIEISEETLQLIPQKTLPLLFKAATGDERPLGNATNHPLRWVQNWIRGAKPGSDGDAIQRRSILINSIKNWLTSGGDQRVGVRALSVAFTPGFETITPDPGSGNTIHIVRGLLTVEELAQMLKLWSEISPLLTTLSITDWQELLSLVNQWIYPETNTNAEIPSAIRRTMRQIAKQMVTDIVGASRDRPGMQAWARNLNRRLRLDVDIAVDREYEILYPALETEDWETEQKKKEKKVLTLAKEWRCMTATEVASKLFRLETEALAVQHRGFRWTPTLCQVLSEEVSNPNEWLNCFIEGNLSGDLCAAFLDRVVKDRITGWEKSTEKCLENAHYEWAGISILIIKDDLPENLLSEVVQRAAKYPEKIFILCLRNEIPQTTLKYMLRHPVTVISSKAAMGTWWGQPRGKIDENIETEWRPAILRAHGQHSYLQEILKSDSSLACAWLIARIEERPAFFDYHTRKEIHAATSILDSEQRLAVLMHVPNEGLLTLKLLKDLANDDLKVCDEILKSPRFGKHSLTILSGHPKGLWVQKAQLGLNAGYSPQEIVDATVGYDDSWSEASKMWQGWVDDFAPLLLHKDERICSIAKIAMEKLKAFQAEALQDERRAAVYGR